MRYIRLLRAYNSKEEFKGKIYLYEPNKKPEFSICFWKDIMNTYPHYFKDVLEQEYLQQNLPSYEIY